MVFILRWETLEGFDREATQIMLTATDKKRLQEAKDGRWGISEEYIAII